MEEWDLYDRERLNTGKTVRKGERFNSEEFHLVVHVCMINASDEMLIQQRQPFKEGWPNMWDLTVGGGACKGESSHQAAERELFEEVGYQAELNHTRPIFTINFERGFDDYYVIEANPDLSQLRLQESEVQAVKWASKSEILKLIDDGDFIPYHHSVINMIFDTRKVFGAHAR
ncbi:MAG: NUDIX domain-containing protein [Cytophagales bacterium]|nr:NUDIX domain-containing protein [Cytophagales bacterium]